MSALETLDASFYHPVLQRSAQGFLLEMETHLFEVAPDANVRFREVLGVVTRELYDCLNFDGVSLEHRSGLAIRIIHEPRSYGLIPLAFSHLNEAFSYRDSVSWNSPTPYFGSTLSEAIHGLAQHSGNVDVHIKSNRHFSTGQKENRNEWRDNVTGAIMTALSRSARLMGFAKDLSNNDITGEWYMKKDSTERLQFTYSRIPGTERWSYGMRVYDVRHGKWRPPIATIQVQLDPITDEEDGMDRRTGMKINKRQKIVERIVRQGDHTEISASDLVSAREILHQPDQFNSLPDTLSKLAITIIRMSRVAANLIFENARGTRFIEIPTTRLVFNQFMVETETQYAVKARLEQAWKSGEMGRAYMPEQWKELVKDLFILGPFVGPYFWRTFFAMGGGYLIPGLEGYEVDWSLAALRDDAREHKELERLYRDFEPDLLAGGPAAYQASRSIGSFCVNSTLARFRRAGLHVPDSRSSLLTKMQFLTGIF